MTIVGKILVFICLVFSLLVGGMSVFVYMARTNYFTELKNERKYRQVDRANMEAYRTQVEEIRADMQAKVDLSMATLKRVQDDLVAQQAINKTLNDKLLAEEQKNVRSDAVVKAAEQEVRRRQEDVEAMRKTLHEEMDKGIKLVKENNTLREKTTAATIQMRAALDANARLENQLQLMARDTARLRANLGATTTAAKPGQKNPPPEAIEGLVKTADPSGLVKITLGSDAGLTRGHTLEVFRINPNNPTLSKYLGTIQIIEVNATEAIGQPMGKMSAPLQAGDHVASRILGNS
jgi:hypothetical protein